MRRLASFATARRQSGQRKQYEPRSSSEHTRTVSSLAFSCTSPQLGQFALMVVPAVRPWSVPVPRLSRRCLPFGRPQGWLERTRRTCDPRRVVVRRCTARRTGLGGMTTAIWHDLYRMAPITFAHRGARIDEPENTIPAFRRALEQGASGLETDAWLASDGEVVLAHDALVRRGLRRHRVTESTADELAHHGVPRLAD